MDLLSAMWLILDPTEEEIEFLREIVRSQEDPYELGRKAMQTYIEGFRNNDNWEAVKKAVGELKDGSK